MKRIQPHLKWIVPIFTVIFIFFAVLGSASVLAVTFDSENNYVWTEEEQAWIDSHKGESLKLGLDPYVGMDYFVIDGQSKGYLIEVAKLLEQDLGIQLEIVDQYNWETILGLLKSGEIDILFGANVTEERLKYMRFSKPIYQYPYSIYTSRNNGIKTLSDIEGKKVGFLAEDAIIEVFPKLYKNIKFTKKEYDNQLYGFKAVREGQIDVFITANGGLSKKFANDFPDMNIIADLTTFTSDMTLATGVKDGILAQIVDKVLTERAEEISQAISDSNKIYNRYILGLSDEEIQWIENQPEIVVGVADDYLPFDYYDQGKYRGIAGDYLSAVLDQLGVKLTVVHGSFDELYQKALEGKVHVMNMAKTEEREEQFTFTKSFSDERDEIFGDRKLPVLQDIYELEDKTVAVVKGYWHKEYLTKNLSHVDFIEAEDIQDCIALVAAGKADYFIENPTVARYYIEGLGYSNVIQKGTTSQDSFLYFGVNKEMAPLVSIFNKSMRFIPYEKIKSVALQQVPTQKNVFNAKLRFWLILTVIILIFLLAFLSVLLKAMIDYKTQKKILEERQKLIYLDGLTGIYNRLYFNVIERNLNLQGGRQAFIMMDLNGLKAVNDTFGHVYGDQLLLSFANCLQETFENGTILRMGGDEFLVILEHCDVHALEVLIAKLENNCIEKQIIINENNTVSPTAAIGWAIRVTGQSVNDAIVEADQMMYQHKASLKRRRSDR